MNKQQNTQQPVAWIKEVEDDLIGVVNKVVAENPNNTTWTPLCTAPQVPRDVLMAFGKAVAREALAAGFMANTFTADDIAAIADRYASKMQHSCKNCEGILPATCAFTCDYPKPEPVNKQLLAALPFAILPDEMKALNRFHECVTDGEGYDVPKEMMKRLAEIGLVRRVTANIYEHTTFGLSVLNGDFDAAIAAAEAVQPLCQTCKGHGVIGGHVGQTPENFDYVTEDCPDCQQPASAAMARGPVASGMHAILYRDNWDGEGDTYHLLAECKDGKWYAEDSGKELLQHEGDAILRMWHLTDDKAQPASAQPVAVPDGYKLSGSAKIECVGVGEYVASFPAAQKPEGGE